MKIYRYWARREVRLTSRDGGVAYDLVVRRGSDQSEAHAMRLVDEAIARLRQRVEFNDEDLDWYEYAQYAKPEPIIEDISDESGKVAARVTLSAAGCQVLNTASLAFVDVDLPEPRSVRRLFSRRRADPEAVLDERIDRLRAWAERERLGARVYRTAGGLRYCLPNAPMDPASDRTAALMLEFDADPLYASLCKHQECFRARLTPKPWRTPAGRAPARLTREVLGMGDPDVEAWLDAYARTSEPLATCQWIEDVGACNPWSPEAQRILDMHDGVSGAGSAKPLA